MDPRRPTAFFAFEIPEDAPDIFKRVQYVYTLRVPWESVWDKIYQKIMPERFAVYRGGRAHTEVYRDVYDSSAIEAADELANILVSGLMPAWVDWAKLVPGPEVFGEDRTRLTGALELATKVMFQYIHKSNLIQEIQPAMLDSLVGTACIKVYPNRGSKGVHFRAVPLEGLAIEENQDGEVSNVYERWSMRNEEILDRFGEEIKSEDLEAYDDLGAHPWQESDVISCAIKDVATGKYSYYDLLPSKGIILDHRQNLAESPYIAWRWSKMSWLPYGRGPAMRSFGDIQAVNKAKEIWLKTGMFDMLGMWAVRDDGVFNPYTMNLYPGAVQVVGSNDSADPTIRRLESNGSHNQIGVQTIEMLRRDIKNAFHADRFGPMDGAKMTATEVMHRAQIISQRLGPTYGRKHNESLVPMVRRVVNILISQGELPKEARLDQTNIGVLFLSSLAQAQRLGEAQSILEFDAMAKQIGQTDPRAVLVMDGEKATRKISELMAVPADLIRSEAAVEEAWQEAVQGAAGVQGAEAGAEAGVE